MERVERQRRASLIKEETGLLTRVTQSLRAVLWLHLGQVVLAMVAMAAFAFAARGYAQTQPGATPAVEQPAPLTLEESILIALASNTDVRTAEEQVAKARAVTRQARAGLGPQVSAGVTHSWTGPIASMTVGADTVALGVPETTIAQLSLALPVDISRQIWTAVESADLARLAQEFGLAAVRQSVALQVQEAYLAVLRAQALESVAREALAAAQEHHQIAQLQQKAGVVAPFDVLRAEVQVASYRQDLLAKQNAVDLAIASLNRVMGTDVNRPLRLVEPALAERAAVELAASQQEAQQRRPEVLQAQTVLQAARKGVKLASAGLQPSFALTAGYSYDANPSGFAGQSESWNVSAAVSLPLFDSGATHARVHQAQSDITMASLAEQDKRQQVVLEVRQAYLSLHEAQQRMSTTEKDVAQAREALRLAQVRYKAGVSVSVEVTDAEVAFAQSRSNQVHALYDYELAQARLDRAVGRPLGEYPEKEEGVK